MQEKKEIIERGVGNNRVKWDENKDLKVGEGSREGVSKKNKEIKDDRISSERERERERVGLWPG